MGIFRYFYWHFKTYPESITYVNKDQTIDGFDCMGIDLNAIFHPVCQEYFFQKSFSVRGNKTMKGCFSKICDEIESIIAIVPPKEELVLAIDGVAGLSKMNQQRQRRFRSAKEKTDADRAIFDSNQISTGTVFLTELSEYITQHFTVKKRPYRVVIMDQSIIGEGEHKLIRHYKKMEKKRIVIFSPDADLIMLAIGLAKKNVFILRPNVYNNVDCTHFMVSIDTFRKQIVNMIDPEHIFPDKEQQVVDDMVFLLYFLGNDFLPHSPSFEIKYKGIDKILELYKEVFHYGLCLVQTQPQYKINKMGFQMMVSLLSTAELSMLETKKKSNFPNKLLVAYGNRLSSEFESYRRDYYHLHFPESSVNQVCQSYLEGLLFVGTYYYQGMPDWLYAYPYYHGPFFHELSTYCQTLQTEWISITFDAHEPLSPLIQLMCVLPPESKRWLPECLQVYYQPYSELSDMYPTEFLIDLDGVHNEYEGLVILPPIDMSRVKTAFSRIEHQLTLKERKRNQHAFM